MKKIKTFFIVAMMALVSTSAKAQEATTAELKVKTSAVCEECKARIEKDLAFEKGVKKSTLDLESKIVTVTYNPEKTTPEKIRLAIANLGYDADKIMANQKAYNKLPKCCQKPVDSY